MAISALRASISLLKDSYSSASGGARFSLQLSRELGQTESVAWLRCDGGGRDRSAPVRRSKLD